MRQKDEDMEFLLVKGETKEWAKAANAQFM